MNILNIFQCLSINYFTLMYKANRYIPLDIHRKIKKYYENIAYIKYLLELKSYIIRICEYIDYSIYDSYKTKVEKLKCYDFSEYKELKLYFQETFYESFTSKEFVNNFYKKIYNKHIMIHNIVIAYEKENKLIYPKIRNYMLA